MILPAPVADWERAQIRIKRDLQTKRREGPWWTGTKEDWKRISSERSKESVPDPFEAGARSYAARKGSKRSFQLANLDKVKMEPKFFPKELHRTIGADAISTSTASNPDGRAMKKLKPDHLPTLSEKLDKISDDQPSPTEDDPATPTNPEPSAKAKSRKQDFEDEDEVDIDPDEDEDQDQPKKKPKKDDGSPQSTEEGENFDAEPEDDMFEEDEDDLANDYNAEGYFDGGDDDMGDEGEGGGYGDDVF